MRAIKKPVEIEFVIWNGRNEEEIKEFVGEEGCMFYDHYKDGVIVRGLDIITLEGRMYGSIGDYIVKGVEGEFYPCNPSIFLKTYDVIEEPKVDLKVTNLVYILLGDEGNRPLWSTLGYVIHANTDGFTLNCSDDIVLAMDYGQNKAWLKASTDKTIFNILEIERRF